MNNAREFLQYIADNEKRLKRNLRKNISFDDDIFDDVFQNTILKIYTSIVKNDRWVENFEKYFFIASKFEYILSDNRRKKAKTIHLEISDRHREMVDDTDEMLDADERSSLRYLRFVQYIQEEFGEADAEIFLSYFWHRVEYKRTSYQKIADEFGISIKQVSDIIQKIKQNLQENEIIKLL